MSKLLFAALSAFFVALIATGTSADNLRPNSASVKAEEEFVSSVDYDPAFSTNIIYTTGRRIGSR